MKDLKFEQTCWACPEQYEVFDDQDKQVAYVRLRWGRLRVDVPDCGGETIFIKDFGDGFKGVFADTERDEYLKLVETKIKEHYNGSV